MSNFLVSSFFTDRAVACNPLERGPMVLPVKKRANIKVGSSTLLCYPFLILNAKTKFVWTLRRIFFLHASERFVFSICTTPPPRWLMVVSLMNIMQTHLETQSMSLSLLHKCWLSSDKIIIPMSWHFLWLQKREMNNLDFALEIGVKSETLYTLSQSLPYLEKKSSCVHFIRIFGISGENSKHWPVLEK